MLKLKLSNSSRLEVQSKSMFENISQFVYLKNLIFLYILDRFDSMILKIILKK